MAFSFDQLRQTGLVRTDNLIEGQWVAGTDGARFAVTDPATGCLIANVPDSSAADARAATDAAARAFPAWRD
ncbi:aldehyde dehydrogenase family protein, partial [Ralstonia sp.]